MTKKVAIYVALVLTLTIVFWKFLLPPIQVIEPAPGNNTELYADGTRPPVKAMYVRGSYSDELLQKQSELAKGNQYFFTVIESKSALDKLIRKYDLTAESGSFDTYTTEFFAAQQLIAVFPEQTSSGVYFAVTNFVRAGSVWQINVEESIPVNMTADIINRGFFIAIESKYLQPKADLQIEVNKRYVDPDAFDKNDLSAADLQLGRLKLRMSPTEFNAIMPVQPSRIQQEQNGSVERRFFEGVEVAFNSGELSFISVTSAEYATVRGLRVGDTVERLVELYGEPSEVKNGVYSFDLSGEYFLFHAKVVNGVITTLQVNLAC